jgi:hypothetical protein
VNVPIVKVVEGQVAIVVLINCFLQIDGVSVVDDEAWRPIIFHVPLPSINAPCCLIKASLAVARRYSVDLLNLIVLIVPATDAALPWLT